MTIGTIFDGEDGIEQQKNFALDAVFPVPAGFSAGHDNERAIALRFHCRRKNTSFVSAGLRQKFCFSAQVLFDDGSFDAGICAASNLFVG